MKKKTQVSLNEENVNFNKAVYLFFEMNPANRCWLITALYLAKTHRLQVVNNYSGSGLVMATLSFDKIPNNNKRKHKEWEEANIQSRSIVADVENQKDLISSLLDFRVDSHNPVEEFGLLNRCSLLDFRVDSLREGGNRSRRRSFFSNEREANQSRLIEIGEILISLSDEWYEKYGNEAFDNVLRRSLGDSRFVGALNQSLTELIFGLLDAKDGTIYNPFAGLCQLGAAAPDNNPFIWQEKKSAYYSLGQLNLLYQSKKDSTGCNEDATSDWKGRGIEYIISAPSLSTHKYYETDYYYFRRSSKDATRKAIGVYPTDFCFPADKKGEVDELFVNLVNKDWIESVILLPADTFYDTCVGHVIITVNKQKQEECRKSIRFVDASDCFVDASQDSFRPGYEIKLLVDEIIACTQTDSDQSQLVPIEIVAKNGYKLYPKLYLTPSLEDSDGKTAVELRTLLQRKATSEATASKCRRFSFYAKNSNLVGRTIHAKDLEIVGVDSIATKNKGYVKEDCLVISRLNVFEASYLSTDGEDVFLPGFYESFYVDTNVVDPDYLVDEMSKDYFKRQLDCYGNSEHWLKMSTDEFLGLKILMPATQIEQKELSIASSESRLKAREEQMRQDYEHKLEAFILNQRQRKHAVAQVLNEIIPSVKNIETFILNNESVSKKSIVSTRFNTTLEDYLASTRQMLTKLNHMVDSFTSQEEYGKPETFHLEDFLEEYCKSKRANEKYRPVFIRRYEEKESGPNVKIARKDLTQMLDNLFDNAVKYGFTEEGKDYAIRVKISAIYSSSDKVVITISNNGNLVSESIKLEKLFTWGIGRGTGTGCWQVKEIAEHYGGTADYQEYPDDPYGFVCKFSISLPIN